MEKLIPIKIPLLNPNEPEALLAALLCAEGEPVTEGQAVAVIETTKSIGDVLVEASGYLVGLRFSEGETLHAGEILAYVGDSPEAQDLSLPPWTPDESEKAQETAPGGLRITAPAQEMALEAGLDLDDLPQGALVTRQIVRKLLSSRTPAQPPLKIPEGERRIVIYGAGGHGRSLAALIRKSGFYEIAGFLDDGDPAVDEVLGVPVLGGRAKLPGLAEKGIRLAVNGVGGIGDLQLRLSVFDLLHEARFHCPSVIHPTAFLEDSAEIGDGTQLFPFSYIGTEVEIHYGCIINTGAIVSHNCNLASFVNLSPGATLAGGVTVGEKVLIGMRATVNLNVHIGKEALIGNGATVKADVPDGGVVPAGTIWPPRYA